MFRPVFPNIVPAAKTGKPSGVVPPAGIVGARTNAAVLKYRFRREFTEPDNFPYYSAVRGIRRTARLLTHDHCSQCHEC